MKQNHGHNNNCIIKNVNDPNMLSDKLGDLIKEELNQRNKVIVNLNGLLREVYLYLIDRYWQDHLENMDQLRESVSLRAYSQKNPLIEYKIDNYRSGKKGG